MADRFTEVTTRSWGSRVGGSFKGVLVGLLFTVAAFPLLWWNEGRAIDRTHTIAEARCLVAEIASDRVDPAHEGAIVHLTGLADTQEVLSDPLFAASARAIQLRRRVEMYQWTERTSSKTTTNVGGSETTETTYSYSKTWSEQWIDSSRFRHPADHTNPSEMPYRSETWQASRVTLGAFQLAPVFVRQIDGFEPLSITDSRGAPAGFAIHASGYYKGSPDAPAVGDLRVSFAVARPTQVSLIGRQDGQTVGTARLAKGTIDLLELGTLDAMTLLAHADRSNLILTWLIRAGGVLLLWIGLAVILAPLRVLADVVPFLGRLVGAGTGLVAGLLAVALGAITIAIAWIFYRPILAAILIGVAVAALALLGLRTRGAGQTKPVAPHLS